MSLLHRLWSDENGQDLAEWALIVAFVSISSAALMFNSGSSVSKVWTAANQTLQWPSTPAAAATPPLSNADGSPTSPTGTTSGGSTSTSGTTSGTTTRRDDDDERRR